MNERNVPRGREAGPDLLQPHVERVMAIERARPLDVPEMPSQSSRPRINRAPQKAPRSRGGGS